MRIEDLANDLRIVVGGRTLGMKDVLEAASSSLDAVREAAPERGVVELPCEDPVALLGAIEACWRTGRVPLPSGSAEMPRAANAPSSDAALVLATSGSTGTPKLCAFDFGSIRLSAERIARNLALTDTDVAAVLSPLHHSYGLVGQLFSAMAAGAEIVWARSPFPNEQAAACARATVISSVAFGLSRLLDAGLEAPRARLIASAGGRFPRALMDRLAARFPNATLVNQYGCTEAGPRLTACASTDPEFWNGSVGRAIEGVRIALEDDGEILFATETQMRGWVGALVPTGDLGRMTDDGHLYIDGRKDDVVKVRGAKVSLDAVARAAEALGATAACAVVTEIEGHDSLVLLYEGAPGAVSRRALAGVLSIEALPERIEQVASLPRSPNGKIDRAKARELSK